MSVAANALHAFSILKLCKGAVRNPRNKKVHKKGGGGMAEYRGAQEACNQNILSYSFGPLVHVTGLLW